MRYSKLSLYGFRRKRPANEAGQALVELALTLPLLVLLLLGAVEFARFAYLAIEMTNAAKAAAQYGSGSNLTGQDAIGIQAVAAQDAPEAVNQCTNFTTTVSGADPAICSCIVNGDGIDSTTACDGSGGCSGYIAQKLTITTSAQCKPLFYPTGLGGTLTITGHAVQEVLK